MNFNLYIFDEFNAIGRFLDSNSNNIIWLKITTNKPIIDNVIDGDGGFTLTEINPNCFEINGHTYYLKIGEEE